MPDLFNGQCEKMESIKHWNTAVYFGSKTDLYGHS